MSGRGGKRAKNSLPLTRNLLRSTDFTIPTERVISSVKRINERIDIQTYLLSNMVFNLPLIPPVGGAVAVLIESTSKGSSFAGRVKVEVGSGLGDVGGGSLELDAPELKSDAMGQSRVG